MRKLKEVLRLKYECGLSNRQIANSCNLSHSTVGDYLDRFSESGLCWPLFEGMSEEELLERLFLRDQVVRSGTSKPLPDWKEVYEELRGKGVTLLLLWQEYRACHPDGYGYSQFCARYKKWKKRLNVSMRQSHKAGEKIFVDYAGQTVPIVDIETRRVWKAYILVAVLGASNYTYAEAHRAPDSKNWIGGHVRAFEYFGGVTEVLVPDNLKAGVKSPCFYEPEINPIYHDMARHYGIAVLPARVRKPQDKAKVEVGVQVVSRCILAVLRKRTFFSIHELNRAIKELLEVLNNREMKHLGKSRRQLFEEVEKGSLKPLPAQKYEYCEWKKSKVGIDYHVRFDDNYYSVPYRFIHKRLDIRATERIIEIFDKEQRVASHLRSYAKNQSITEKQHMPENHRWMVEWTPERLIRWGCNIGPHTTSMIKTNLASSDYVQQSFRRCMGILKLAGRYSPSRLEAACERALHYHITTYKGIKEILDSGYDRTVLKESVEQPPPPRHKNIRGEQYYAEEEKGC